MKMKGHFFLLLTFFLFCMSLTAQESFESGDFSAYSWQHSGNANWTIVSANPQDGTYCAKSGDVTHYENSTMSITLDVARVDTLSFYWRVSSEAGYDFLQFYIDGGLLSSISGITSWSLFEVPVPAGEHTFTWKYIKDRSDDGGDDAGYIDNITFPEMNVPPVYDLQLDMVEFPARVFEPSGSYRFDYHLSNVGSSSVTGYTLALYKEDGTLLHSSDFTNMVAAGADLINLLTWNAPSDLDTENTRFYGKITTANDENEENNVSEMVDVKTIDADENKFYSSDEGTAMFNQMPFDLSHKTGIYQTIIPSSMLAGSEGYVYEVSFYNNFSTVVSDIPVQIYMGETEENDLQNGWIQLDDQYMVFDGTMNFDEGDHMINIQLDVPFAQRFGNLAVTIIRGYTETAYSANNKFYCNSTNQSVNKSRILFSDAEIDMDNDIQGGILSDLFANITICMNNFDSGEIGGYVIDSNGNPIAGAIVSAGIPIGRELDAVTDENGRYIIRELPAGTHNVSYSATGFDSYIEENVSVTVGEYSEVNVTLTAETANDDIHDLK